MQYDLFVAKRSRDEALERVSDEEWEACVIPLIASVFTDTALSGEDIRLRLEPRVPAPRHHNCWGTLIMHAIQQRVIFQNGKYVHMRGPKSNARKTPLYELVPRRAPWWRAAEGEEVPH